MTRYLYVAVVLMLLTGCGDSPPVPTDYFYRLTLPAEGVEKNHITSEVIYVGSFVAEGLYNERALLYTEDEHGRELQQHHYHFWVTSPPHMLRDYLVDFLRTADVAPTIIAESNPDQGLEISGKVIEFEKQKGAGAWIANVGIELRLQATGEKLPRLVKQYHLQEPITSDAMTDTVAGFNTAVWKIYNEFLSEIRAVL